MDLTFKRPEPGWYLLFDGKDFTGIVITEGTGWRRGERYVEIVADNLDTFDVKRYLATGSPGSHRFRRISTERTVADAKEAAKATYTRSPS